MTDTYDGVKDYEQLFRNAQNRTEQKRKMKQLMAKYGETEFDIEKNSTPKEYMEFVLAGGRDVLEMVRDENAAIQADYNPYSHNEDVVEEEEIANKNSDNDTEILKRIQKNSEKDAIQRDDENTRYPSHNEYIGRMVNVQKVKHLKSTLSNLGYYQGEVDNLATPGLVKAINDFSEDYNIKEIHPDKLIEKITQKVKSIKSQARLDFDGQYLRWIENGKVKLQINAMSGKPGYQNRRYQNIKDKGPLPEGNYRVKQNQIQDVDDTLLEKIGRGKAPGGRNSWGYSRVWLQPFSSNEMYGRNKLTIHGGNEFGSAGCIDLEKSDRLFFNMLRKYGKDIILNVHYDKEILK